MCHSLATHLLRIRLTGMFIDCADSSVVRTSSRQELLYPRSKIAAVARAFGLEAIDMVCDFPPLGLT